MTARADLLGSPPSSPADRTLALAAVTGGLVVSSVFLWITADLVLQGASGLTVSFLVEPPRDAGREGGISSILLSTLLILSVCIGSALPIALGTATCLVELCPDRGPAARLIGRSLDILAGTPSIVFGLFGNAFFCKTLGLGFSILAGGLTLACMALPLLTRAIEQSLRAVPRSHREAAAAAGLSRSSTLLHLVLPSARRGIAAGLVLSVGRALAETAALIFTSGYVTRTPSSLLDSGRSLSVHVYDLAMNVPGGTEPGYTTALVLLLTLFCFGSGAGWIARTILGRTLQEP